MKRIFDHKKIWAGGTALGLFLLTFIMACEPENYPIETTDEKNATVYFEDDLDTYSKFLEMLDHTNASGFLGAYGTYTVFAPTNEAVDAFLAEKGVSSVAEFASLHPGELREIVEFHIVPEAIETTTFTDGKLSTPSLYGQYIITGAENVDGVTKIRINRQADLVEGNIEVGNGIIHNINTVLEPASQTLAEMLESDPDYSIFTKALKATSFYDSLGAKPRSGAAVGDGWYTVIAQTDEVYSQSGINSFEDLKARYSNTGNPLQPNDSLFMYIAYRILGGNKYLADIVGAASHQTMVPQEVITTKLKSDSVLINEDVFKGVLEKGAMINRSLSDNSATNGVLHSVNSNYEIKIRNPFRVYFDVADQPEFRLMPSYRTPGSPAVPRDATEFKGITTEGQTGFDYVTVAAGDGHPRAFFDYLSLDMRNAKMKSITFKTPILVKGQYKVWICFRRTAEDGVLQVFFNDQLLTKGLAYAEYYPGGEEGELLAQGWKRYTTPNTGHSQCRLVGTIDVETTDTHEIKLQVLIDDHRGKLQLDMIQFIPVEQDQLWPKIAEDGSLVYPE